MNPSRSLRQPQYNTVNSNHTSHGLGINVERGLLRGLPASRTQQGAVPITMRSHTGMMGMAEAEYGAHFLQLTPAASQFCPGAVISPASVTPMIQHEQQLVHSTSISLGRQPTLFTKNASPTRKVAELITVLGDASSGRLNPKARLVPSHLGGSKRFESNPASPIVLLEQAKSRARVELDLLLDSGSCVEGGYVKGKVLVNVAISTKKESPIYLGEGKVRVVGFEAIPHGDHRHTFYHCAAPMHKISPFCHILYTSEPDDEGFCRGREGNHSIPFAMRLPQRLTNFPVAKGVYDSRVNGSSIRYIAMFSIKIKDTRKNARSIAHFYRSIEVWPLFDPEIVLAPAPTPLYASTSKLVFMGGPGTVKLTASLHRPTWVAGQRCYVRIFVANDTEKRKVQSLSLTLVRSEIIFKPNPDAAVLSLSGTRISNDLDACRTSTFKRIIAKSVLEMGEKVTAKHATAKGWWTGVEPGTSQEFNHFILLPPFALTIPRSRLVEVTFILEASVSTGPLASDVAVRLPLRIINHISLDPPPAFGPPEKLRNLPPVANVSSLASKPGSSDIDFKGVQLSVSVDSETLARPQPSYIYTETGTYRGDGNMPTLGKLVVRNRASVASGTMGGQSASRLSRPLLRGQEWEDPLPNGTNHAPDRSKNELAESTRPPAGDSGQQLPNMSLLDRGNSETKSLEEYVQGPRPDERAQVTLSSISLDAALGIEDYYDDEVDLVMRSVDPNNFEMDKGEQGIEASQSFGDDQGDERRDGMTELDDAFISTRNPSPTGSQESSTEVNPTFSTRVPSRDGSEGSKTSFNAASAVPSAPEVKINAIKNFHPQTSEAAQRSDSDPLSPMRTGRRFLPPQRPRPHPILASKARNMGPSGIPQGLSHPKGTAPCQSLDLSGVQKAGTPFTKPNALTPKSDSIPGDRVNIGERNTISTCDEQMSQGQHLVPVEPNHSKTATSATTSNIPTSISALMLQNLKTPVPGPPSLIRGTQESASVRNAGILTETHRVGSYKLGSATRIPPPAGTSSIKARIAMFEQGQVNTMSAGAYASLHDKQ